MAPLLAEGGIYQCDTKAAAEAARRLAELDDAILEAMQRWEELAKRA
jgi:hypothetical protein